LFPPPHFASLPLRLVGVASICGDNWHKNGTKPAPPHLARSSPPPSVFLFPSPLRLVGVARVPKVEDIFMDTFLMLPTDALAIMKATLDFS
jgi:hypothetical protein